MAKASLKEMIASVETWASKSDDRVQLLMMLIWAGFAVIAIVQAGIFSP